MESKQVPFIRVEYEIPPLRAIYMRQYHDDGQSDEEIVGAFHIEVGKEYRVRKITRGTIEVESEEEEDGK